MTKVIVDETLRAKLNDLTEEKEFCDETGRTLGHYVPSDVYLHIQYEILKAMVTDEEIEQARQETGGHTTAEVLEHINFL